MRSVCTIAMLAALFSLAAVAAAKPVNTKSSAKKTSPYSATPTTPNYVNSVNNPSGFCGETDGIYSMTFYVDGVQRCFSHYNLPPKHILPIPVVLTVNGYGNASTPPAGPGHKRNRAADYYGETSFRAGTAEFYCPIFQVPRHCL